MVVKSNNIEDKELKNKPQTLSFSLEDRIEYMANLIVDKIIEEQNDSTKTKTDAGSC